VHQGGAALLWVRNVRGRLSTDQSQVRFLKLDQSHARFGRKETNHMGAHLRQHASERCGAGKCRPESGPHGRQQGDVAYRARCALHSHGRQGEREEPPHQRLLGSANHSRGTVGISQSQQRNRWDQPITAEGLLGSANHSRG
jgi:hypothetical protein